MRLLIIFFTLLVSGPSLLAGESVGTVPNEYETVGGSALAAGNNGVAAEGGVASVRLNPAMLALEKSYAVAAGFNWPTAGREFYQAGVVDTSSGKVAAGVQYTGFTDDPADTVLERIPNDSAIKRRLSLGLAQVMGKISAGLGVQYVEGSRFEGSKKTDEKGTTIGFGVAGMLTNRIRFGAAVENLANKKVAHYAPRVIRVGANFLYSQDLNVQLDLRQRERVVEFEAPLAGKDDERSTLEPERMATVSGSARVYDMIRLLAAYGQSIVGPERKTVSGGLAIVNKNASISFSASRPYLTDAKAQQAINGSYVVNF